MHALTTDYADTSNIAPNTREVMLDYLAAGLDPAKSTLFVQSHVTQHFELPLYLGHDYAARLAGARAQLQGDAGEPVAQGPDHLRVSGLSGADGLGHSALPAEFVPVGQDQQAHVELTREVARRFNHFYKLDGREVLPEPNVLLTPSPKLPGTDGRKMSKSYGNTILLTDPEPVVRKKLKTMVTDPARVRRTDPGDPDKCPVGDLHKVFSTPETLAKVYEGCRSAGIGCIECKGWAADALVQVLKPIQERRAGFTEAQVEEILKDGRNAPRVRAEQTMVEVRAAMQMPR